MRDETPGKYIERHGLSGELRSVEDDYLAGRMPLEEFHARVEAVFARFRDAVAPGAQVDSPASEQDVCRAQADELQAFRRRMAQELAVIKASIAGEPVPSFAPEAGAEQEAEDISASESVDQDGATAAYVDPADAVVPADVGSEADTGSAPLSPPAPDPLASETPVPDFSADVAPQSAADNREDKAAVQPEPPGSGEIVLSAYAAEEDEAYAARVEAGDTPAYVASAFDGLDAGWSVQLRGEPLQREEGAEDTVDSPAEEAVSEDAVSEEFSFEAEESSESLPEVEVVWELETDDAAPHEVGAGAEDAAAQEVDADSASVGVDAVAEASSTVPEPSGAEVPQKDESFLFDSGNAGDGEEDDEVTPPPLGIDFLAGAEPFDIEEAPVFEEFVLEEESLPPTLSAEESRPEPEKDLAEPEGAAHEEFSLPQPQEEAVDPAQPPAAKEQPVATVSAPELHDSAGDADASAQDRGARRTPGGMGEQDRKTAPGGASRNAPAREQASASATTSTTATRKDEPTRPRRPASGGGRVIVSGSAQWDGADDDIALQMFVPDSQRDFASGEEEGLFGGTRSAREVDERKRLAERSRDTMSSRKSPLGAAFISIFIAGGGMLYTDNTGPGVLFSLIHLGLVVLYIAQRDIWVLGVMGVLCLVGAIVGFRAAADHNALERTRRRAQEDARFGAAKETTFTNKDLRM